MNKLFFCGKVGENYGWGTCIKNLKKHLSAFCEVEVVERAPTSKLHGPAFVPIIDYKLNPIFECRAEKVIGYCFTEAPLDDDSRTNAAKYDFIFAGSSWNKQRIKDAGIKTPCEVLLQGVDHDVFKPQPPSKREGFVVFSGGKYEYRKGQDYVCAAMNQFMRVRGDAVLVTAWHNHWPGSEITMKSSWLVNASNPFAGLPMNRVFELPLISHTQCAEVYAQSHIGLFPNRCEAGTNLVMMEYMACGRPVIASYATGQKDVLDPRWKNYLLKTGSYDPAGWFNPEVSDIICSLEYAYAHRDELPVMGAECAEFIKHLTWERCARQIYEAAFPLDLSPLLRGLGSR